MNTPTKSTLHKTFNISPFSSIYPGPSRTRDNVQQHLRSIRPWASEHGMFPNSRRMTCTFSAFKISNFVCWTLYVPHPACRSTKNIAFALPVPSSNQNWWRLRRWHQSGTEGRLDRRSCSGWNISQSQKNGVLWILHMFVGCFTSETFGHKLGAYAIEILSV